MPEIISTIILGLLMITGLIISFIGMPGPFVITLGYLAYSLMENQFSWTIFLILIGLSALSELIDFLLVMFSGKKFGASKKALFGAILGGIIGAAIGFPILFVGSFFGLFAGLFLGAFITEYYILKNQKKALRAAVGVFIGKLGAILIKVAVAVANIIIIVNSVWR